MFTINKSAYRAIEILSLIADNREPMTIAQISKQLEIPKSSAFSLLYTLVETGVLVIDSEELKTFKLGIKSFEIGSSYLEEIDLIGIASKHLEKLAMKTGETTFLDVEDKGNVIHIHKVDGTNRFRITCPIGVRNHMHCTSVGKALLATYPEEKIKEVVQRCGLPRKTEYTLTDFDGLMKELQKTRKRGYAIDAREDVLDGLCIGAPLYDHLGKGIASISMSCQYSKDTESKIEQYGACVSATAFAISKQMGFKEDKLYYDFDPK